MDINKITNSTDLIKIESKLVEIFSRLAPVNSPYGMCAFNEEGKEIVESLFKSRKELLDSMFVMDDEYKLLLYDFNEAIKLVLIDLRHKAIEAYNATVGIDPKAEVRVAAKCYLGCTYPELHPIQTLRAKKMWAILTGACGDFEPKYKDGVLGFGFRYSDRDDDSENRILYMKKEPFNWNEGLDEALTQDMNLTYAFYNLHHHCNIFSIFDLLWVREFSTEITVTTSTHREDIIKELGWFNMMG